MRENRQNWYFLVYIFPKGVYPLKRFLQNLAWESDSQVRTLVPNLTIVPFKIWAYSLKIAEIGNSLYKCAQKVYTPLSDFYNIWLSGGSPRFAPSYLISLFWL